jgi:hypothetical protein
MEKILINGLQWLLDKNRDKDRKADLHEAKERLANPKLLKSLLTIEVRHGYGLVIPRDKVTRVPNTCLVPINNHAPVPTQHKQ